MQDKEIERCEKEIRLMAEMMGEDGYAVMGWVDWQAELELIRAERKVIATDEQALPPSAATPA